MQIPAFVRAHHREPTAIRRFAGDFLVLFLAGGVVAAGFIYFPRLAPSGGADTANSTFVQNRDRGETDETTEAFLERVASAHVATLSTTVGAAPGDTNELAPAQATSAPRSATALRHGAVRLGKAAVVASAAPSSQAPSPADQTRTAGAPAPFKIDWLAPLHYGIQLASDTGKFVAASNARVMGAIASAGDTLTSFGKKPKAND
jgi:hypothetical protein